MSELPNYIVKLLRNAERLRQAGHLRRGTVSEMRVLHDDRCSFWRGLPCDCDPDLVVRKLGREVPRHPARRRADRDR